MVNTHNIDEHSALWPKEGSRLWETRETQTDPPLLAIKYQQMNLEFSVVEWAVQADYSRWIGCT